MNKKMARNRFNNLTFGLILLSFFALLNMKYNNTTKEFSTLSAFTKKQEKVRKQTIGFSYKLTQY